MKIAEKAAVVSAETVVSVIHDGDFALLGKSSIVKFATLIAEAEREACAKVCAGLEDKYPDGMNTGVAWRCAEAIMARCEK